MSLLRHAPVIVLRSIGLLARWAWIAPGALSCRPRRVASLAPGGGARQPLLFIYSQVVWDEVWQRPQEFALRAAARRPVVFFCPVQVHRLQDSLRSWRRVRRVAPERSVAPASSAATGLTVVSPLILPGEYKSRLIRSVNAALIRAEMRRLIGDGSGATLLTNSPFAAPLLRGFRWRATVYDVIDDYAAFDWAPPEGRRQHEALLRECDAVFTGTGVLREQAARIRDRERGGAGGAVEFIPCGVRFELFHRADSSARPTPAELAGLRGPIVGYVGSLSERLDRELIESAARRYPGVQFVFIGPIHGSFGPPPRAANVHYLGLKPHEALPDYMNCFDLALMPFRLTEATRAINPVKTLEYLAAGCVVLSTALPDVERYYGEVVVVARSRAEFVESIGELLRVDNEARRAHGVDLARAASWDTMAERMMAIIEQVEKADEKRKKTRNEK